MKEGWKEILFKDFIKLNRGFDLPNSEIEEGEYPVVASTSIKAYHNKYKVNAPCVVTGRSGSLGVVQYVDKDSWPLNTSLYVKDFKGNVPKFVYFFLQTMNLDSFNSGAGVPTLNQNHLHFLKILIPSDINHQKRIADILSAYDDLIEVNNKRIELLEQSARELYKEWFVRMRFPNHENTKFNKGIPEGWEVKKIEDISNSQYGYTASSYDVGDAKFLRITDIVNNLINWEKVPFCSISQNNISKYSLKYGDIVIARTGATVGYAKRINKDHPLSVFASYLVRLQLKDINLNYFLGIIIESEQYKEYVQTIASGAAQPNANASMLTSYSFLVPKKALIESFNNKVSIVFDQIENLQQQNQQLTEIRNRLLPRLIGGKLEVKV